MSHHVHGTCLFTVLLEDVMSPLAAAALPARPPPQGPEVPVAAPAQAPCPGARGAGGGARGKEAAARREVGM